MLTMHVMDCFVENLDNEIMQVPKMLSFPVFTDIDYERLMNRRVIASHNVALDLFT